LANYAQPLIRYEIGDIVTMAAEHCNCGSNLSLVESIEGRDAEMFEVETGHGTHLLQPMIFQIALARMLEVREYQIIQKENRRFHILLEPLPGQRFDRERATVIMDEELRRYGLDRELDVELEAVQRLTPDGDQKFQRVVYKTKDETSAPPNRSPPGRQDYASVIA
jgi:phenylacetate-coenzyme A ligase PaaK-like adenylate-forming protein